VFNPHPHAYEDYVELEANLDYRPIRAYEGRAELLPVEVLGPDKKPVPFQLVETEHAFSPRRRGGSVRWCGCRCHRSGGRFIRSGIESRRSEWARKANPRRRPSPA